MNALATLGALVAVMLSAAVFLICKPPTMARYLTDLAKFWGTMLVLAASTALVIVFTVYVVTWALPPII